MPKIVRLSGVVVSDRDAYIYEWWDIPAISPKSVLRQLADANGDDLEVYISSNGGSSTSGSEIYTALKEYAGKVIVKIPSLAASAASIIAAAADRVLISPTAQIMIHNSSTWDEGNKERFQQTTQMLESFDEGMVNAYVAKTGKSAEEIRQLMKDETFMNAQRAVELGFADEIMFAANETEAVASAGIDFGSMLPPQVLDKMRIELKAKGIGPETQASPEPVAQAATPPPAPEKQPEANQNKEGHKPMDMNEFKASHPDVYSQVLADAAQAERQRINGLNALAKAPGAQAIVTAAIESGKSVEATSLEIVLAMTNMTLDEADKHKKDAEASGADKVNAADPTQTPESKKQQEEAEAQREADEVRAEIDRLTKKGGK